MPVRIRLRRMGRKGQPHYRIVVSDGASPRDGRFVETLGYYKPLTDPARVVLDLERVDHWLGEGASPSGTVKSLISKARRGGDNAIAFGEEGVEERKAKRAEELAAKRAAEQTAAREARAQAEAAEAEAAEPEAAEDGEGTEAVAPQTLEAEVVEAPSAEAEEAQPAEPEEPDEGAQDPADEERSE